MPEHSDLAYPGGSTPTSQSSFGNGMFSGRVGPIQHNIIAGPSAKHGQENVILQAMRRQMEALEDRLSGEIARVRQDGDRQRDTALQRVDTKMGTVEALQPRFDRRVAELAGNYKGLSDEMQLQIRRIDQMDARLWDWRHQLDEEVRVKFADMEKQYQKSCSMFNVQKAAHEETVKRHDQAIHRLEGLLAEHNSHADAMSQSLTNVNGRLTEVEERRIQDIDSVRQEIERVCDIFHADRVAHASDHTAIKTLDAQVADMLSGMEGLQQVALDLRTRLETTEERCKSVRTLCESKDEQYRLLNDRITRDNWDGLLKDIQSRLEDVEGFRIEHGEKLGILQHKFDSNELAHELAPLVATLVSQLKDVAPKVIEHEKTIRSINEKIAHVELMASLDAPVELRKSMGDVQARIGRLEAGNSKPLAIGVPQHEDYTTKPFAIGVQQHEDYTSKPFALGVPQHEDYSSKPFASGVLPLMEHPPLLPSGNPPAFMDCRLESSYP